MLPFKDASGEAVTKHISKSKSVLFLQAAILEWAKNGKNLNLLKNGWNLKGMFP